MDVTVTKVVNVIKVKSNSDNYNKYNFCDHYNLSAIHQFTINCQRRKTILKHGFWTGIKLLKIICALLTRIWCVMMVCVSITPQ